MTRSDPSDALPNPHSPQEPISFDPLDTTPAHPIHEPRGSLPNTPLAISLISLILGSLLTLGFVVVAFPGRWWWATAQLGFYTAAWAGFHWGEFAVTAGWNREKLTVDSFLLNNGAAYYVAHGCALLEYLITLYFWPAVKQHRLVSAVGVLLTLGSQALRSAALLQASSNFSHTVATRRLMGHQLVTTGVYAYTRHPSYVAFFYWALGTQVALLNPISFCAFYFVQSRFFSRRIREEERFLVRFFGDDYVKYKEKVGTGLPFIR